MYEAAETVEKVQMSDYSNFRTFKNQQPTAHRKPQNSQIRGFPTTSLYCWNIWGIKNYRNANMVASQPGSKVYKAAEEKGIG